MRVAARFPKAQDAWKRIEGLMDAHPPPEATQDAWTQWRGDLTTALDAFGRSISEEVFGAFTLCGPCKKSMQIVYAQVMAELAAARTSPQS